MLTQGLQKITKKKSFNEENVRKIKIAIYRQYTAACIISNHTNTYTYIHTHVYIYTHTHTHLALPKHKVEQKVLEVVDAVAVNAKRDVSVVHCF